MRHALTTNARRRVTLTVVVLAGVLGLSACGSTGHTSTVAPASRSTTSESPAASAAATVPRTGLARFLLAAGEEKSFPPDPGEIGTFSSLKAWVSFTQLTAADGRLLRSEGFVGAAQESIGGASNDGASFVEEFGSATGARHEAANDADQAKQDAPSGSAVVFFPVPGLANAHGVFIGQAGGIGTDIYWTEGHCTLWLGNEGDEPLKFQVEAGAKAIDRRTGGTCP